MEDYGAVLSPVEAECNAFASVELETLEHEIQRMLFMESSMRTDALRQLHPLLWKPYWSKVPLVGTVFLGEIV
jgi:hypothetical protein